MDTNSASAKTAILAAIICLAGGIVIGFFMQPAKSSRALDKFSSSLPILSSPVIAQIAASGQVTAVSGKTITVSARQAKQDLTIGDKTVVQTYIREKMQDAVPRAINLSDIKTGQSVSILLKVLASGELQVVSVSVTP